jgi:hypothetical protein
LREGAYVALLSRKVHLYNHFNVLAAIQIGAIAAFAGLSVEVKESTAGIIKTPTLTNKDGFSVFGASAIGRYSESYRLAQQGVKHPRLSHKHLYPQYT